MTSEVLIVGAGPAGSIAALVLARAGVRVRVIDRATFPRDKLCGDTVNPGTLAVLRRLGVASSVEAHGLPVRGMRVTGPNGVAIEGRYPAALCGRAIARRHFDMLLLDAAIAAGAEFETGVRAGDAVVAGGRVTGVRVQGRGGAAVLHADVIIAADGRRSTLAFHLGLTAHPRTPRRWAVGAYYDGAGVGHDVGEMHIRGGRYIGVAPIPGGLTNVCVVAPLEPGSLGDPSAFLRAAVAGDLLLDARLAGARQVTPPVVLGPLAVDATGRQVDGLILAGDAAGFIDPMTGDGLRFAVCGGELAAEAALAALSHGWRGVHARHVAARQAAFAGKWRFNRTLRSLVAHPHAVTVAARLARFGPPLVGATIRKAGDCALA